MNKKNTYKERLPIAEWPEIERKMAIIAKMTSEPPQLKNKKQILELEDEPDVLSPFSKDD